MALQGEGDPRWVVRQREDGRNVNGWHWEDKDVTDWAKDRIRELLTASICSASEGDVSVSVEKVDSVDGDATLYNRKGILKVLYDLKVAGKWTTSQEDKEARTNGEFKFELFDEDPDIIVTVDSKSKAESQYKTLFTTKVCPVLRDQCCIFIKEMHAGAGQSLEGLAMPVKKKLTETKVTDYLRSGMNQKPSSQTKTAPNTSTLVMRDVFNCNAKEMYLALTDQARLEAITRARVLSEAKEGGRFNLLNGAARGSYLRLLPSSEIRMKWKLKTWADEAPEGDATIVISEEEGKANLEVTITGVPNSEKTATEGFWRVQIFQAMKVVMGWGSASQFL